MGVRQLSLRPELVDLVLILRYPPELHRFSVSDVPNVDVIGLQTLTVTARGLLGEDNHMVVAGEQIVNTDTEGTVGKLHEPTEECKRLFLSFIGPGNQIAATDGPADVRSKNLGNRLHIPFRKRLVSAANQISVVMSAHRASPSPPPRWQR